MFSISKNDVSEFLKKEKNTNEFYGSFFSFFPLPMIHLVIPMESRELGATRDLALQRPSFSLLLSTLAPYCLPLYSCSLLSSSLCASAPLQITLTFQQILFVHFGLCLCYTNFAIRFFVFRSQHFLL